MENIKNVKNCTGCYACKNICPKACIDFKSENKGFMYPIVDENKCIKCGLCTKICPQLNDVIKSMPKKCYALKHKNDQVRFKSTSGGAFTAISDVILENYGIVYGATMDSVGCVKHIGINNKDDRNKLRKSKYLQSSLDEIYKKVKKNLLEGKKVLFTGTPCQVSGLKVFLQKEYDNLYTCDVICHGVSSKNVFEEYIKYIERKHNKKCLSIDFRTKINGWQSVIQLVLEGKSNYIKPFVYDVFGTLFTLGYIMRESCYECKYASAERASDITMGDFWGIDEIDKTFNDKKGTSMLLVNTSKGEKLINLIMPNVDLLEVSVKDCIKRQGQLQYPIKKPKDIDEFWRKFENEDKINTIKKYSKKLVLKNRIIDILGKTGMLGICLKIKSKIKG